MALKPIILLTLMYVIGNCMSSFANGRAKWLVESKKEEEVVCGFVIKEVKTPPVVSNRWFDYDNQGEIPRGAAGKSSGFALIQHTSTWEGIGSTKIKLGSGSLNIYSFWFIRSLLFPHHVFD